MASLLAMNALWLRERVVSMSIGVESVTSVQNNLCSNAVKISIH